MGILIFFLYIAAGLFIGLRLRPHPDPLVSGWIGCVIGVTGAVWLPVVWALLFGKLNLMTSAAGAGTMVFLTAAVCIFVRRGRHTAAGTVDAKVLRCFFIIVVSFTVLETILLLNHVILPRDGALWGGQSTYGDLSMHLGMITSMAEQGTFPPDYSICPGVTMGYPFLVNALSAWIMIFGNSLRAAVIVPSAVLCALIFSGFWLWMFETSGSTRTAVLAFLLFFVGGGIGAAWFLDGSAADSSVFTRIFTGYYNAPTNYPEYSLRWVNVLCDMILPQRTTMLGWVMIPAVLVLTDRGLKDHSKLDYALAGILAGAMPMMHTHSFVGVGIVGIGWAVTRWPWTKGAKAWGKQLAEWLCFLVPVVLLALPQLMKWTFAQSGGEGFLRYKPRWVNSEDPFLWFWFKNLGPAFLLLFPALFAGRKKYLAWYTGAAVIFVIGQIWCFQPNPYDNNKLLLVWWMLSVIPVAEYMGRIWDALRCVPGRAFIAAAACVVLFASGLLTIAREWISGGEYQLYSAADLEVSEYVLEETDPDGLFLTGDQHLNPIAVLSGRSIYVGTDLYLYFHGIDTAGRHAEIDAIYTNELSAANLPKQLGAEYIMVSNYEAGHYAGCREMLAGLYPCVFTSSDGSITLYRVE